MKRIRVLTLIGGISRDSLNKRFFHSLELMDLKDFEFDVFDISHLPYFSQDLENDPPDVVTEFKEKIRESDGLLVITPEYNRSFPGVLKNAIDWGSRPYGHNLWAKKPAAIMGASIGNIGTFGAQNHLRQVFVYLDVLVMAQPEFYFNASKAFDESGRIIEESTRKLIMNYFSSFREHVQLLNGQKAGTVQRTYSSQGLEDSSSAH